MAKHVMIDLETLSTRKDAAIVQLAALAFDPETGETFGSYNAFVLPRDGEHINPATVAWWLRQSAASALGEALTGSDVMPLGRALCGLWDFFDVEKADAVWSHGATFDIAIVENHCARLELGVPWSYKAPRDTRTLYALAPGGCPKVEIDESRKHDALYDCEVQVQQVCGALKALRDQAAEVERWKEEYRVTEEARAAFEAAAPTPGSLILPPAALARAGVTADDVAKFLKTAAAERTYAVESDIQAGGSLLSDTQRDDRKQAPGYAGRDECGGSDF